MKKYILYIIIVLKFIWANGQMIPESTVSPFYFKENTPKTPEATSLGTYGTFQASQYNGKANIDIPLHTIDFDGIQIPISLSYNSSGVRVNQESSWVGLNWNLSTSFGISRTIYGADDFDDTVAPNQNASESSLIVPQNGYIYNFFEVPPLGSGASTPNVSVSDLYRVFGSFLNEGATIPSREIDTQPDVFEANVFGSTYKFRLIKKGSSNTIEAKVFNNNNVKITFDLTSMSFYLLDDRGFMYNFTSKDRSTTFVPIDGGSGFGTPNGPGTYPTFLSELRGDSGKEDEEVITYWHLDSVTSPYGDTLTFDYIDGLSFTFPSPIQSDSYNSLINTDYRNISTSKEPIGNTTITKRKYLTKISGDFGSVDFELGSRYDLCTLDAISRFAGLDPSVNGIGPLYINGMTLNNLDSDLNKKLERILIKDFNGEPKKTVTFQTSYYNADKINDPVRERYLRLKLDAVQINDQKYSFDYIDSNNLPSKDSRSIDFWGFYNGVGNTDLIPTIGRFMTSRFSSHQVTGQYFLNFTGGIRKSDFNYGRIGLLNKVTYPTKGFTEFVYEPHEIVLPITPAFNIQDYIELNGISYMRWTDMTNESRYNFTYQYLKYATDPSYDYYNLSRPELGNPIETPILTGQPFSIQFPSSVTAIGVLSMVTGEGLELSSEDFYYIENIDTGDRYSLISYLDAPTSTSQNINVNETVFLNPGNYRVRTQYFSGPVITFSGNLTLNTYENTNIDLGDFYERFEIGGARIAQIKNRDVNGEFISSVAYTYDFLEGPDGLRSSGKLMDELMFFSSANGYHSYNPHSYGQQGITFSSSNTLGNTPSAKGSHIGYSYVQESQLDINGNNLGRIDRTFKNEKNRYFTESWSDKPWDRSNTTSFEYDVKISNTIVLGLPPKNNYESSNGLVVNETIYDVLGDIVQATNNEYQQLTGDRDDTYFTKFMPIWQVDLITPPTFNQFFYYQIPTDFSDKYVLSHSETKQYFQENEMKTEEVLRYDLDTHYTKESETVLKESESYKDVLFYPYDDAVASQNAMDLLRSENKLSTVVREENYHDAHLLATKEYLYDNSVEQTAGNTMLTSVKTAKSNENLIVETIVEQYDAKGNMLQYKRADGVPQRILWGYNDQYPIAKIENMGQEDITNLESQLRNLSNQDDDNCKQSTCAEQQLRNALQTLRETLPEAMVTTYTYDPLIGVTSITDPRGYTMYYEYDAFNRLKEVKDADGHLITDYEYDYKQELPN